MRRWTVCGLLGLALLVPVVAGCGGGGSEGVAAIETNGDGSGSSGGGDDGGGQQVANEDAALEWAQCMREQGVKVDDPDANGMFQITPETSSGPDDRKFEQAREECGPPPLPDDVEPPSEAELKKQQESMLAFARCMRTNGVEMDDPTFGEGGAASLSLPDPSELSSPEFQSAQKACSKHFQLPGGDSP